MNPMRCDSFQTISFSIRKQGIAHDMYKQRLDNKGGPLGEKGAEVIGKVDEIDHLPDNYCGSCYGAETVFRE